MNTRLIDELFAFVSVDDPSRTEGQPSEALAAFRLGDTMMPMIAADAGRVDSLRDMAQAIATASGRPLKLVRFDNRTELETINP